MTGVAELERVLSRHHFDVHALLAARSAKLARVAACVDILRQVVAEL